MSGFHFTFPSTKQVQEPVAEVVSAKKKKKKKKSTKEPRVRVQDASLDIKVSRNSTDDDDLFNIVNSSLNPSFPENPDDLPDPVKLLEKAIEADFDPGVFSDQDFPKAANVIEWCRSPDFLNSTTDLFPRQFQVLSLFFEDVCYFCSDVDYVFNVPVNDRINNLLDRFALLEHGVCPICHRNRLEILSEWVLDPKFAKYKSYADGVKVRPIPPNELCCVWGQRSGKSHMTSSFTDTYQVHRYLSIPNPMQYYNEPANKVIEGIFVATTLPQVNKSIWRPFCQALENSPWFKDVLGYLKSEGKRIGMKLFRSAQTYMIFPSKRLTLHMTAASSSGNRGGTRSLCTVDELGWFNYDPEGKQRSNTKDGTEVFRALHNSLTTLRAKANKRRKAGDYNVVDAVMVNVSSPSSKWDPIMTRASLAATNPRIYHTHFPSWEVNPDLTEEEICEEFAGDPEKLYRDFYAIPPDAASPFFSDREFLENKVYSNEAKLDKPFAYHINTATDIDGMSVLQVSLADFKPDKLWPRVVAIDNGERKNSFALCMGRYLPEIEGCLVEELVEVAPHDGLTVDLAWAHNEFVLKLVDGLNIPYIAYDRWNSGYSFYDLRVNKKVTAERYSLKWQDFRAFKEDLLGENIWFTEREPNVTVSTLMQMKNLAQRALYPKTHLLVQLLTVNEFGRSVVKPEFGNDDLFRATVLCHYLITKYKKQLKEATKNLRHNVRGTTSKVGVKRANVLPFGTYNLPRSWYGQVPHGKTGSRRPANDTNGPLHVRRYPFG